jgi:hypothetical protein
MDIIAGPRHPAAEYVIVAACIVGAVIGAFGPGATGAIETALAGAIALITAAISGIVA